MAVEASVRTLRAFLKDEREAASRYRRALPRFTNPEEADELNACLASHERRIARLEGWIQQIGERIDDGDEDEAQPEDEDGGDAIGALEESEDRALKHYLDDVAKLDGDSRRLVAREILPEQVRTYDWVNDLRLARLD
jgi:hypothetical protein